LLIDQTSRNQTQHPSPAASQPTVHSLTSCFVNRREPTKLTRNLHPLTCSYTRRRHSWCTCTSRWSNRCILGHSCMVTDGMGDWVACEWGLVEDILRCRGRKGDIRAGIL
jgi:hypothetical protein